MAGYILALIVGIVLGAFFGWTMWATHWLLATDPEGGARKGRVVFPRTVFHQIPLDSISDFCRHVAFEGSTAGHLLRQF